MSADTTPAAPSDTTPSDAARATRLKRLLIASMALNLIIVGGILGAGFAMKRHGGPGGGGRGGVEDFGLMRFSREITDKARKDEIRKELRQAKAELLPKRAEVDQSRLAAAELLAKDPLDREALKAAMTQVREKESDIKSQAINAFIAQVEKLTPAERVALSERWKRFTRFMKVRQDSDEAKPAPASRE